MKVQNAANNSFLAETKQTWSADVFRDASRILNDTGEMAAREFLVNMGSGKSTDFERRLAWQNSMFGCTIDDIERPMREGRMNAEDLVFGMMSDAQEEMAMGSTETARKTLNRAKHVLDKFLKNA